jgi:serine/threonine protein kinase
MKVTVRGKFDVDLEKNDFVTEGGEGKIYSKNGLIYKIYEDPNNMIPDGKINELKVLDRDNIIIPLDVVFYKKSIVGFTMKEVKDTSPLCQFFTTPFRNRNGITPKHTTDLVENIQKGIEFIHSKDCLIVDVNELNFLVDNKSKVDPWFIDTNSYKTPSFPATAIMDSIRDWRSQDFSQLTDWFSFSILCFQLFVGLHPYRGSHPDYGRDSLAIRMRDGISVFNKKVSVPNATRDFSCIPSEYMRWFESLYIDNKRIAPPSAAGVMHVIQVKTHVVTSTAKFKIQMLQEYPDLIIGAKTIFGRRFVLTKNKLFDGKLSYDIGENPSIILTPKLGKSIAVYLKDEILNLIEAQSGKEINMPGWSIAADKKFVIDNTLYIKRNDRISEISVFESGERYLYSPKNICTVMPKATKIYGAAIYQNVLGRAHISIINPVGGVNQIFIPELDGVRIIRANYESKMFIAIGIKDSKYHRFIFRFSDCFSKYDMIKFEDIPSNESVNFTVLDNGLSVMINHDGQVDIMSNVMGDSKITNVLDPDISTDMILFKNGQEVLFYKENKVYSLSMK